MASLRAIHVVAGLDAAHGGPSYAVPRLCKALAATGVESTLLSVQATGKDMSESSEEGYRDRRFARKYAGTPVLGRLCISPGLGSALRTSSADVIHNHGLWLMPNLQAGWAARLARTPLVVGPRGMLNSAALEFSSKKKRVFWQLMQGPAIRHAACLHATSDEEYRYIREFGLSSPVAIIPNGIEVPEEQSQPVMAAGSDRVVLSLGRIHPIKGLDRLVRSWARVEADFPKWRLRIVGFDERNHAQELRALVRHKGLTRVSIEPPIYGNEKHDAYLQADLFVLASLDENFAVTVAEALAAGTPVISTRGAPWSGIERMGCGWWIDHGVEPLAAALTTAMAMPRQSLRAMGAKGCEWMRQDFSWERVAHDMLSVYRWLSGEAEAPATVRFS
jgi:glycosyltransferase involved in cell wall biosynthesis